MIELLIGAVVAAGVAVTSSRGYSANGVLMLLGIQRPDGENAVAVRRARLPAGARPTRSEYVKILLMSRGGDLGMMIMMLCGFRRLHDAYRRQRRGRQAGLAPVADDQLALSADGGGLFCRLPDVVAVSSATGLGVADGDAVPVDGERWHQPRGGGGHLRLRRRRLFWRRPLATWCWRPRRRRCRWWTSRSKPRCRSRLPPSSAWPWHFFWQRYLDKKNNEQHHIMDISEINTRAGVLCDLPFTPILGVLIFDGKWGRSCISLPYWSVHTVGGRDRVCAQASANRYSAARSGLSRHGGRRQRGDAAGGRVCSRRAEHRRLYQRRSGWRSRSAPAV